MENILITGGAGFIGSHLVDKLNQNYNIICIDNFDSFYEKSIKENNIREHINLPNFKLYNTDITDYKSLSAIFDEQKIDKIVHLAAKAGVRPSISNPQDYVSTNICGTTNLLELARKHHIEKFVFASSSSVYGEMKQGPFKEDMVLNKPISPYAATKLAGEQLCYTYNHLFDINITCLRFFTVYGPRQRPDLAIHKFFKLINEEKEIPVFGDGSTKRDYTFIDDIIQGVEAAINYDKTPFEIFNLGESNTVELKYLIQLIEQNLNKKAIINKQPIQPGDVPITYADINKSKEILGYSPSTQIESGLVKFKEWFLQ